jgi:1-deoxy-D-xylulose-5-phosphate synthase
MEARDEGLLRFLLTVEKYGVRYIGPIDGHDPKQLEHYLEFAKNAEQPVLLHVLTTKGKGYDVAIENPERFHGASPYDITTGKSVPAAQPDTPPKYQDAMGKTLVKLAREDSSIVGITAAMPSGTGLNHLEAALPQQFVDVGIAEEHAVLFAAGMATSGYHPVCAIYSTFLQRAFDQVIHDVAIQQLPVAVLHGPCGTITKRWCDSPWTFRYQLPAPRAALPTDGAVQ